MIALTEDRALGENHVYAQAKAKLAALQEAYSKLIAEYTDLIIILKPNLETDYMTKIGKKEYILFSLHVAYLRLKREIALYQAAKNQGEAPNPTEIESALQAEFETYLQQLDEQQRAVEAAEAHFLAKKMSAQESQKLKELYHTLVKKIHPDINPDLPPKGAALWEKIQECYRAGDSLGLLLLADMVDELLAGRSLDELPASDPLEHIQQQHAVLLEKSEKLQEEMRTREAQPPLCYRALLNDPDAVLKRREELDREIQGLKETINMLEDLLGQLKE